MEKQVPSNRVEVRAKRGGGGTIWRFWTAVLKAGF